MPLMDGLDPVGVWTLRLFVAALLARAAVAKLRAPRHFAAAIRDYALVPEAIVGALAVAFLGAELLLAIALLVPITASGAAFGTAALLALYTGAIGLNLLRGRRDIDCGCAGPAARQPLHEGLVLRNGAYLAAALVAGLTPAARALHWIDLSTIAAGALSLLALSVAVDGLIANAPRLARHPSEEPA